MHQFSVHSKMAMEIITQVEFADNQFEGEEYSTIDDELKASRGKDSGHWSFDEEESTAASPLSVSEQREDEAWTTCADNNKIPFPPPLPPSKGYAALPIPLQWTPGSLDDNNIPIPPPLPPLKGYCAASTWSNGIGNKPILLQPPLIPLKGTAGDRVHRSSLRIVFSDDIIVKHDSMPAPINVEDESNFCCIVCFDPRTFTVADYGDIYMDAPCTDISHLNLPCCNQSICKSCIDGIISTVVGEGRVQISCPHPECDKPFTKQYILSNISSAEVKRKYQQFLVDVENDGKRKTCPKCCHITEHELPTRIRQKEKDLKIDCNVCQLEWCFRCHAPWHKDISCRQFQKGNKEFQKWTKGKQRGVANCQKCPTCRVYIQRSSGCHFMQCNRCDTDFCYDCGSRFLELGIIDHRSTLNVWGCPENYHKDEPFVRHSIRWGYMTAKLSYLIAYPPLLVGACGLLVLGAVIILPVYAGFKLHSYSKFKQANNGRRKERR